MTKRGFALCCCARDDHRQHRVGADANRARGRVAKGSPETPPPPGVAPPPAISILFQGYRPRHSRDWWRRRVRLALQALAATGDFTVLFTDDARMRALNLRFRGKDASTDVLSFGDLARRRARTPREGADGRHVTGDVVISGPTAERNARQYRQTAERELLRLVVHGVLHAIGYDHEKDRGEMAALQERLVASLTARGAGVRKQGKA